MLRLEAQPTNPQSFAHSPAPIVPARTETELGEVLLGLSASVNDSENTPGIESQVGILSRQIGNSDSGLIQAAILLINSVTRRSSESESAMKFKPRL